MVKSIKVSIISADDNVIKNHIGEANGSRENGRKGERKRCPAHPLRSVCQYLGIGGYQNNNHRAVEDRRAEKSPRSCSFGHQRAQDGEGRSRAHGGSFSVLDSQQKLLIGTLRRLDIAISLPQRTKDHELRPLTARATS